jgi:hypothetical protein
VKAPSLEMDSDMVLAYYCFKVRGYLESFVEGIIDMDFELLFNREGLHVLNIAAIK